MMQGLMRSGRSKLTQMVNLVLIKLNPLQVVENNGNIVFCFLTWLDMTFKSQDSIIMLQPKQE